MVLRIGFRPLCQIVSEKIERSNSDWALTALNAAEPSFLASTQFTEFILRSDNAILSEIGVKRFDVHVVFTLVA